MAIFFNFSPTPSHLHPLQVQNCVSNSRLVVDEMTMDNSGSKRSNSKPTKCWVNVSFSVGWDNKDIFNTTAPASLEMIFPEFTIMQNHCCPISVRRYTHPLLHALIICYFIHTGLSALQMTSLNPSAGPLFIRQNLTSVFLTAVDS